MPPEPMPVPVAAPAALATAALAPATAFAARGATRPARLLRTRAALGDTAGRLEQATNVALVEYKAPDNFKADDCHLCRSGIPITRF